MKNLIAAATAAAISATTSVAPALAQSSWVAVGESDTGTRHFVQKHNWQGRYRTFGLIYIKKMGEQQKFMKVADCSSWSDRIYGSTQWSPSLPNTMGDAQLRYVCS